ncbi:MAG: response regulator transcription factor [Chloroflexia bacterium]
MTAVLPLILVVDDNPWFREFLEDLLSVEGYRVMAVGPGEALAAASVEPPALAVLDAVMPGMDGPSLCRQMREADGTRDTPILFLTGLPEQALVTQLIDCDGWSYLSKPCTPEELLDAVQQQVARPGVSS